MGRPPQRSEQLARAGGVGRLALLAVALIAVAPLPISSSGGSSPPAMAAAAVPAQVPADVTDAADCDAVASGGSCTLGPTSDGSPYVWTVPAGLTRVLAVVRGASGSTGDLFGAPGAGGMVIAEVPLTPGSQLTMWVATAGNSRTGGAGWARGGDGGRATPLLHDGAGGGGASAIADGNGGDPVVVGAGGGGGGSSYNDNQYGGAGGAGSDTGDSGSQGMGPPREQGTGGVGGCGGCESPGAGGEGHTFIGPPGGGGGAGWGAGGGGGAPTWPVSGGGGGGGGRNRIRSDAQMLYSGSGRIGQGVIQLMPAGSVTVLDCQDGAAQTYTPPSGADSVVIVAVGGQGSRGHNDARVGHPAVVDGLVDVDPGESLQAVVGCSGDGSRRGYGDGGDSGDAPGAANDGGGAGGGSAVWGGDGGLILVAGGGGGTGGDFDGTGGYGGNAGLGWGPNGAQDGQSGQGPDDNGDGGCGGCESQPGGGEGDNTDFPNFGGAGGGGGGGYDGGAGGEDSFNSAGGGGGGGSSYFGTRLQDPGIGTAGVNHARGNGNILFIAMRTEAALEVTKQVTGPGTPAYSSGPFQLQSVCTKSGTTVLDETATLDPAASATYTDLPVGASCTVTEPSAGDGGATVPAAPQTVTLAAGSNLVTMTNVFDVTTVQVTVEVDGASQFSFQPIVVHLGCAFNGRALPLPPPFTGGVLTFPEDGGTQAIPGLPQGAACSFSQPAGGTATVVEYESVDPPYARSVVPPRDLVLGAATAQFTVIDTWLLDDLSVSKALGGTNPPLGLPFPMTVTCTFDGQPVPLTTPTFSLTADETQVLDDIPVGAVCDVVETDTFDATTTTYTPAQTVVVARGGGTFVLVTNTFDVGSLALTKVVSGAGASFANTEFVVHVLCVDAGITTLDADVLFAPTGGSVVIPSIATNSVCTVTEPGTGSATATTFTANGTVTQDSATVTITDGTTVGVIVTNRFDVAPLQIDALVTGSGVEFAVADLTVVATCTFNDLPVADRTFTFFPFGGTARFAPLPVGARCTVDETETGGADPVVVTTVNATDPVIAGTTAVVGIAPLAAGAATTVRYDNTIDAATLTVTKVVDGPAAYAAGPFSITVACTFDGRPIRQLGPDGWRTFTLPPTGGSVAVVLPVNASCDISEPDDGGATTVDISAPTLTIPAAGADVTVTNTFLGGNLAVGKIVDGNDALNHQVDFPIEVACTFDGRPVDAPDGQPMSFPLTNGATNTLTDLPVGAECAVAETSDEGATTVTYTSTDSHAVITPFSATVTIAATPIAVTVTNTFEVGTVEVDAVLLGPGAPTYGAGQTFTVRVGCTRTIDGINFPIRLPNGGDLTLDPANGLRAAIPAIDAGVRCAVADDEIHLATSVSIPNAGLVPGGGDLELTIVLEWQLGSFGVAKVVTGRVRASSFAFQAACSAPTANGPVAIPLAAGAPSFTLGAGQAQQLAALSGASCTLVETNDGGASSTSYAVAAGTPAPAVAGIGILLDAGPSGAVTVTNVFAPSPPPPHTKPSGNLAKTGAAVSPAVPVGLALLAGGICLRQLSRRRLAPVRRMR